MEYRVLGPLEVRIDGEAVPLGPPKQRAVLAILLLRAGEIVPTDLLIDLAWGDAAPRTAPHSLQIYVSELRKTLERDGERPAILTRPPGYVLEADPEQIDARRFETLVERGARDVAAGDAEGAAAGLRAALELWRGAPLADFAYEEFAQDAIRRLETLHLDALEQLASAELTLGREPAALAAIAQAVAEDPLRDRCCELQMLALYRSGRQPDALRAYETFRAILREELGTDPTPALRRLQERILLHDPTLGPVRRGAAPAAEPLRNPYKGLRPFDEADAGDFFGRDGLVGELVDALKAGRRLVALVGASGSGKSSVLHAGLLPALRAGAIAGSDRWRIARMNPGERPFEALEAALRAAGVLPPDADSGEPSREASGVLAAAGRGAAEATQVLLAIDQFEELFSIGDEATTARFLFDLAAAVAEPGGSLSVVLALRADFYDRPLLHPAFAPVFTAGVVNVVPPAAEALEAAIVRPARRAGLDVDRALLARLTADTAERPGALPLLQYTLTELFERRAGPVLTLADYRATGGLGEALSRRAEELFAGLTEDRRRVALQVFLRLVAPTADGPFSRRRVALRELTGLGIDPVALSEVLDAFGGHRLLSFDRELASGDATVEVAHEALLTEWKRLADWLEEHRADLRQHDAFASAAGEWEASGRDADYLLIGSRLDGYLAWSGTTALGLTPPERDFLDAAIERRSADDAAESAILERQRRLERRARRRLWAALAAVALLAAMSTFGLMSWAANRPPDVALLVAATGDGSFGDMAVSGVKRAAAEFGFRLEVATAGQSPDQMEAQLRRFSERGVKLVVEAVGYNAGGATAAVARDHPGTRYIGWEGIASLPMPSNVTELFFAPGQAAYLAGAAAAMKSRTGIIGFIGASQVPFITEYFDGFERGARAARPNIRILPADYLTRPGVYSGFSSPELAGLYSERLYAQDADVVLVAAGASQWGTIQAAELGSAKRASQLWAIGTDFDSYQTIMSPGVQLAVGTDREACRRHILTSVMKRLDVALYDVLRDYGRGTLQPGRRWFGLAQDGVDISYSGGFLDDVKDQLGYIRARIVAGEIAVPSPNPPPVYSPDASLSPLPSWTPGSSSP